MRVVPSLDELEDRDAGLRLPLKPDVVEEFTLEPGAEGLTHRVVIAVAD